MLRARKQDDGIVVEIRVQPKSSANRIVGEHDGALKVAVTTAPEGGKANEAVIRFLSKLLGVPKSDIEIIAGATSRGRSFRPTI